MSLDMAGCFNLLLRVLLGDEDLDFTMSHRPTCSAIDVTIEQ